MPELWPTADDLGLPANMVRIHKAADIGPHRTLDQIVWDIVHDTQGGAVGSEQVLTAADSNIASCHAMLPADGSIVLMVPLNYTAWTPGNDFYAQRSINLEIVGFDYSGFTDAQYRTYAAYHRWAVKMGCPIANAYIGKKGLGSGILGHQDVPNPFVPDAYGGRSGHTDPGPLFKWDLLVKYIGGDAEVFDPNPKKFDVGPGMLGRAATEQMIFITNEQFFIPDNQPGLGKMSRAWVQDSAGVTYIYMASELVEQAKPGQDTPWKVEKYRLTA